jgi:hypothetical protein
MFMRKEIYIAIFCGLFLGIVLAFGIFRVNRTIKIKDSNNSASSSNPKEKEEKTNLTEPKTITLLKPSDKQVFSDSSITISGLTNAESYIVTTGGNTDQFNKSDNNGNFEYNYKIDPSLNNIEISSLSPDYSYSNIKLEVAYSTETGSNKEIDTNNLDKKVENKLEKDSKIATFIKGTITDLTSNSLQIEDGNGVIGQISYTKETTFAKIGKTTTKITENDIAIGDFIIALGYKKENGVIDSFRILITQPSEPVDVRVFFGVVSKKDKTGMEVSPKGNSATVITIDNNTKTFQGDLENPTKIRFASISVGDEVIGTYIIDNNGNTARRIHLLQSSK